MSADKEQCDKHGATPRTDAAQYSASSGEFEHVWVVDADFAGQLERELAVALSNVESYAKVAKANADALARAESAPSSTGTPVAWQAKHPGERYEWFQTTKEVFDRKGHGAYEYRELYAAPCAVSATVTPQWVEVHESHALYGPMCNPPMTFYARKDGRFYRFEVPGLATSDGGNVCIVCGATTEPDGRCKPCSDNRRHAAGGG